MTPPSPPKGLRTSGRRLWREVVDSYELEVHESLLLRQACRCADRLDELATLVESDGVMVDDPRRGLVAHPAAVEHRQQSITMTRLLASLRLPSGDEDEARPQRRGAARGAYQPRSLRAVT